MGRKPLADIAKKAQLRILLTENELAILTAAASVSGKATATWARDLLLAHAGTVKPSTEKKAAKKSRR